MTVQRRLPLLQVYKVTASEALFPNRMTSVTTATGGAFSLDPPSILVGSGGPPSDLDFLVGAWMGRRSVRLFHCRSPVGPGGAVVGQTAAGGPQVASNS